MPKRVLALICVLAVMAVLVIELRHRNRVSFVELQTLLAERDALNTEWGQLLLEEGAWAEHRRVDEAARVRLGMTLPPPEQITIVRGGDVDG